MTRFRGKRFRGRSDGPPVKNSFSRKTYIRLPAASSPIVSKSTCHPEEGKPWPARV